MWVLTIIFVLGAGDAAEFRVERLAYASERECGLAQGFWARHMDGELPWMDPDWRVLVGPLPCTYDGDAA